MTRRGREATYFTLTGIVFCFFSAGDHALPEPQNILLGFKRDEAVAFAVKSAEFRGRIPAHAAECLIDDIEAGNHLRYICQARVLRDVEQPERLDVGLAKDRALPAELEKTLTV